MFISIIVILISVKTCIAQVATCKDDGNVDPPNVLSSKLLKSAGNPAWAASGVNIDQNAGHSIIRTMANFVQYHAQINVLAYSDDPPNLPPRNEKSKSKGVLLVRSPADEAAWFVHTVPNFLAYLNAYSWPAAETAKGHMFLCVSFNKAHLNSVGKAIRYQEPYVYVNNLPAAILNQNIELSNLINGIDVRVTSFLAHETFATKSVQAVANIQAFGKHSKSFADMYARILRNRFAASIMVWSPADARSKSICRGQHKLQKITSIQLDGVQVSREADSAKWALIDGKNTVCFTTNDYTATDKRTPGAAVCLENAGVYNAFRTAALNHHFEGYALFAMYSTKTVPCYETGIIMFILNNFTSMFDGYIDTHLALPHMFWASCQNCSFRQLVPTLRYQLHGSLEHHQVVLNLCCPLQIDFDLASAGDHTMMLAANLFLKILAYISK
ncbi:deoxyribonuclease II superfamily [Trichinella spiralis]|uniref:deoxyribonuclease II superfamily n=1 Tax=Trichinella spiralis TaxID=6334 RepID=UPI0001EFE146|nr:deoxyribonuclease II superfamily [Trichinella spiralis]